MGLEKRVATGALWLLLEKAGTQVISFLVFVVVARVIAPAEYGLISICFVIFSFANMAAMSLPEGIVSRQITDQRKLSTIFWAMLFVGFFFFLSSQILAGTISELFGSEKLESLMRLFSFIFLLLFLSVVPNRIIDARMNFKIYAMRMLFGATISGAIGVYLALHDYGAYAIAWQQLVLYAVMNIIVWSNAGWAPTLCFEPGEVKDVMFSGLHSLSANIVSYLEGQTPRIIIALVLGPAALGHFAFVSRILQAFSEVTITSVTNTLLPTLTKAGKDVAVQMAVLGHAFGMVGIISYPAMALAVYLAPVYVPLWFGVNWVPAVPLLQFVLFSSACAPVIFSVRETMRSQHKMRLYVMLQIPILLVSSAAMTIASALGGLPAFAITSSVVLLGSAVAHVVLANIWLGVRVSQTLGGLFRGGACALVGIGALAIAQQILPSSEKAPWLHIIASGGLYLSVFLIVWRLFRFPSIARILTGR